MTPKQNGTGRDGMKIAGKGQFFRPAGIAGLFLICLLAGASPVAATGSGPGIQVWSNTPNAYVTVAPHDGGMNYGGWTDNRGFATFDALPKNTWYRVTVSKDGYNIVTQQVFVDTDTTKVVGADLQPWW